LRLIRNDRVKGGCGARNSGILAAKGDLIAFLDDDDILFPNALATQATKFSNTNVGMVYGAAELVDEIMGQRKILNLRLASLEFNDIIKGHCPSTSSVVMARKSALLSAGLFDERLPSFQDFDLWLRLSKTHYIERNETVVAQFVQHRGIRTSVELRRRLKGLDMICDKWGHEIGQNYDLDTFRRDFTSRVYSHHGRLLLTSGWTKRAEAIAYLTKAVAVAPSLRHRKLAALFLGIAGLRATQTVMRLRASYLR
jgi:glycosyltransferase involved in cell wall biosynthesis